MIKLLLSICLLLAFIPAAHAQMGFNSPVSVTPATDFEFYARDGFLVQRKYQYAKGVPEGSINTMSCVPTSPTLTAAAGILKDPSGDANYTGGISYSCTQTISVPNSSTATVIGIELMFDDFDTTPQSLAPPTDYVNLLNEDNRVMYVLTGRQIPQRHILSGNTIRIQFITNNDASVGRGFQLRWRALVRDDSRFGLYESRTVGPIAFGHSMKFDVYWGSLSAGLDNLNYGYYSTVLGSGNTSNGYNNFVAGRNNTAEFSTDQVMVLGEENKVTIEVRNAVALGTKNMIRGSNSMAIGDENTINGGGYGFSPANAVAIGKQNTTNGIGPIAIGYLNTASGNYSTALGRANTASGENAMVMSLSNTASGIASLATGYLNIASGNYSTAMGHRMNTNGQAGAFMIGDTDPLGQGNTGAGSPDQFVARFRNGYYLMTSGTATRTGAVIGAGQNAWSAISDSTRKERFLPMNHADVLQKINAMKLTSWNYKGQREIRHYGPMAQDFYAAFGHDGLGPIGCDTLINSHDFAGVTFAGVQALIRENETLKTELQRSRAETQNLASLLAAQKTENAQIQADFANRLHFLERALLTRRERVSMRKTKP